MRHLTVLKRIVTFSFISSSVLFASLEARALTVEEVTNPRQANGGWVSDMADILNSNTEQELNRIIAEQEQADGTEITVVTVPETAPADSPKAFATELFNHWGIGKAELNNGILFLISKGDNRVEIETGYGIAERLDNSTIGFIINQTILPEYKAGDFNRGTLEGTQALIRVLQSDPENVRGETAGNSQYFHLWLAGVGTVIMIGGITLYRNKHNKVFVKPNENIKMRRNDKRTVCCAKCHQPMTLVENIKLTKAQQIAQEIGGAKYQGYRCSNCSLEENSIVAYFSTLSRYDTCPQCEESTVTKTNEVLTPATRYIFGQRLIQKQCHCCDYQHEQIIVIPKITPKPINYHNNQNSQNHHHDYGSSSSGNSSSAGSFGGGSSGGDGAGGSW